MKSRNDYRSSVQQPAFHAGDAGSNPAGDANTYARSARSPSRPSSRAASGFGSEPLKPLRPPKGPGVYAIQGIPGFVKIGRAKNIAKRMRGLQDGHPAPLKLLAVLSRDPNDEAKFHQRAAHSRAHGEWFRATALVMSMVMEARALPPPRMAPREQLPGPRPTAEDIARAHRILDRHRRRAMERSL